MHTLKGYVCNKARPERSIAKGYINNECLKFCLKYLKDIETRFNRPKQNFYVGDAKLKLKLSYLCSSKKHVDLEPIKMSCLMCSNV